MNGKRIVVTRAVHQAEELGTLLRQRGAEPLFYPCISLAPPQRLDWLDAALQAGASGSFDWLVLTSANAVPIIAQRLAALHIPASKLACMQVACVGPATAAAVNRELGLTVETMPETYVAEALAGVLKTRIPARILLLQADIARPALAQELTRMGALVCAFPAYRTVQGSGGVDLPALLEDHLVDAITFTSASTVAHCVSRLQTEGGKPMHLNTVCLACIGPVTAEALRKLDLRVQVEPTTHTIEGLVDSLEAYFRHIEAK
jgi:uroporphyrinogen-III synthase